MTESRDPQTELLKIEAALAAQEALRGILPDEQLEAVLASLRARREALLEQLSSSVAATSPRHAADAARLAAKMEAGRDLNVGEVVAGDRISVNIQQAQPGAPSPEALRASYLNRVLEATRQLSLAGIDPKAASESGARLNLGAVYTALLTHTPLPDVKPDETIQYGLRRLSVLDMLNREPRLVLLGDPGSGKSTFVNFAAMCLAGEGLGRADYNLALLTAPLPEDADPINTSLPRRTPVKPLKLKPQPWAHGALLPMRIILRDFAARGLPDAKQRATANDVWRFVEGELEAAALGDYAPQLRQRLIERGGLLLLDGLDEVPEADRRRVQIRQAVEDFAATFPRCRILVTSRTYAYQKQDWRLPGFAEAILAPFSPGQIRQFIDRWYDHIAVLRGLNPDDARGKAELLKYAIFSSDRLPGLAERPLLLTLMASLHAWRGGSLPEKREQLYSDTVDLLLDWWESPKAVRNAQGQTVVLQPSLAEWLKVDRGKVRDLLNEIAYRAHAAQPDLVGTADVTEGELVSALMRFNQNPEVTGNPALLVYYLSQRAGLLLPHGVGVYTFPHRTFQEYLAACYLTDHDYPDRLAELARADPNRWREVALLAGAKAARGSAFAVWALAEALCYRDVDDPKGQRADAWGAHLAGQALAETTDLHNISERYQEKVALVRRWLIYIVERSDLPAVERARAGDTLARLGDPRAEAMTIEGMEFSYVPAGTFVMGEGKEQHLNAQLNYDYWLGCHPVTQAQFSTFVGAGGYAEERYWPEARAANYWKAGQFQDPMDEEPRASPFPYGGVFNLPNHPVVGITWYEALAFCRWLTETRAEHLPPGWVFSLPSEAEWEKAARGSVQIPPLPMVRTLGQGLRASDEAQKTQVRNKRQERIYPWGATFDPNLANMEETRLGTTSAIGCFPGGASPYAVLDMSGNVLEWMRGHDAPYPYDPRDGREVLSASPGVSRATRGGAFSSSGAVHCAARASFLPGLKGRITGFRVAAAPIRI